MTKKILLAGASTYGVKNMGDDAMLYNLTQTLHKKMDCEITFLARHPEAGYDDLYGIRSIKNYEHDSKAQSLGRWFYGFNPGDSKAHLSEIRNAIEESDLVIIGGNSFMEVSSNQFMRGVSPYSALLATFSMFFEKPYVLYGVAGHPLKHDLTKELARFLCGNAELVTVREKLYKQILSDAGAVGDHIKICGDPAWGIDETKDSEIGSEVLNRDGISFKSDSVLGIGFRHMYWQWDEEAFASYSRKMAQLCDFVIDEYGSEILFIPNCTYNVDTLLEDDRHIAQHVIKAMKNHEKAHLVNTEMNLIETLSLYQHVDMVISNRRHSNIFAAVHRKPILALSTGHPWQFKPFMADLELGDHYASLTDDPLDTLQDKVRDVWKKRTAISEKLGEVIPLLKQRAHEQVDMIADILKSSR